MRTLILFLLLISIRVIAQPIAWDAVATQNFIPHDPWRDIDGKQEYAKGDNWVQFVGTIIEVQPKGVRIRGYFFNPAPVSGRSQPIPSPFGPKRPRPGSLPRHTGRTNSWRKKSFILIRHTAG